MKTLYESILSSTGSGKNAYVLGFDTKAFTMKNKTDALDVSNEICNFYNINQNEAHTVLDVYDAMKAALKLFKNRKISVVLDKTVIDKMQKWYNEKAISFSWDPQCVPTIFETGIPLVIKVKDEFYIWHWGTKRDLFTHQLEWLTIYKN